jgi:hypothetical protein
MVNNSVVEVSKGVQTVASVYGAAKLWEESRAWRIYQSILSGPPGPDAWQRGPEVPANEFRAALTVRIR